MIPKILHFIWLGNNIPLYAEHCIKAFSNINKDFNINFVTDDIRNPKSDDVKYVLDQVNIENSFCNKMFNRPWAKANLMSDNGMMSNIADCLKYILLEKYGGIYLDCDTFPVKPFDDLLLKNKNFIVEHKDGRCDNFFIGSTSGNVLWKMIDFDEISKDHMIKDVETKIWYHDSLMMKAFKFKKDKLMEKFINGTLTYSESIFPKNRNLFNNYYIDHYRINSWKS